MRISTGMLHSALRGINAYVRSADEIEQTIIGFGIAAAASSAAVTWVPAAGELALVAVMTGFTYGMYIKLAHLCKIKISQNFLKSISSMVISNLVSNLAALLVGGFILGWIPVVGNIGAAAMGALIGFASQYIAGIIFIKMMTAIFKCQKDPSMMSEDELTRIAREIQNNEDIKKDFKEAKNAYKDAKDDSTINTDDYKPVD